jgi:hypothetical protein
MRPTWRLSGDHPSVINERNQRPGRFFSPVFLAIATFLFAMGMATLVESWNTVVGADLITGIVVAFRPGGYSMSSPVIRYEVAGKGYEITALVSSGPRGYSRGDPVKVRYHPERPGEGRLGSFGELWFFPIVFLGTASLFATLGILAWMSRVEPEGDPGAFVEDSCTDRRVGS